MAESRIAAFGPLQFELATKNPEIEEVYNYNLEVFSETPEFSWTLDNLKDEAKQGWKISSVRVDDQIIAAVFYKADKQALLTKSTPIKMEYQGNGYSHKIKEYFEKLAKDQKLKEIVNYCGKDNFRLISLNETHGYEMTGQTFGDDGSLVEWKKQV